MMNLIINNIHMLFIGTGILTMIGVLVKDMCDNEEVNRNTELINKIAQNIIKVNLLLAFLSLILLIYILIF